jgi:TDG/mug DNA glycosylase family protein
MIGIELKDSPIYSFEPIADSDSKVLILGTIPGKESLRNTMYYAHPQNAFWKIIFALHEIPFSTNNRTRTEVLLQNKIALWDVLQSCSRKSSLDNDIRMEQPNDLRAFLTTHPEISEIFFNGRGAAGYFKKYFDDIKLPNRIMPSTSPAHAVRWEKKLEAWQAIKTTGNNYSSITF